MSKFWEDEIWATEVVAGVDKFIALALARRAGEDALAWPSAKTLAGDTGLSINTAGRSLKSLEDAGVIARTQASEVAHLGAVRSVIYKFTDPGTWPTEGIDSPPEGDDSPPVGYVWTPDAAPVPTRLATQGRGTTPPEGESARPSGGITSTTSNGHESDHGPRVKMSPMGTVSNKPASRSDLVYFRAALQECIRKTGVEVLGPVNDRALGRNLKLLRSRDRLSQEQIRSMIDAYMAQPSAWNKNTHPWQDFCSAGTLTRLRNQTAYRDAKEYVRPSAVLTEAMPVLTLEDIKKRDLERGPSWLRK